MSVSWCRGYSLVLSSVPSSPPVLSSPPPLYSSTSSFAFPLSFHLLLLYFHLLPFSYRLPFPFLFLFPSFPPLFTFPFFFVKTIWVVLRSPVFLGDFVKYLQSDDLFSPLISSPLTSLSTMDRVSR